MDRKREREREDKQIILIILMFHIKIKIDDSLANLRYKSLWILVTYPMPGCREEGLKGTIATCDLSKSVF